MRATPHNYLKLLAIEADDVQEDVELQILNCQRRRDARDITEHVYGENMAVFRNQQHGMQMFLRLLSTVDADQYPNIEALITALCNQFITDLKRVGLFPCIGSSVERKLRKIQLTLETLVEEVRLEVA